MGIVIKEVKQKYVPAFIGCIAFTILGFFVAYFGGLASLYAGLGILFFGGGTLVLFLKIIEKPKNIIISDRGLKIESQFISWNSIKKIGIFKIHHLPFLGLLLKNPVKFSKSLPDNEVGRRLLQIGSVVASVLPSPRYTSGKRIPIIRDSNSMGLIKYNERNFGYHIAFTIYNYKETPNQIYKIILENTKKSKF